MLTFNELNQYYEVDKQANFKPLNEYKEAVKYYHGDQLPQEALSILANRGQPPLIENIYKLIVNKILGYKIQSKQEIRVFGRTEKSKAKANLLQDIARAFNENKTYDREIYLRDRDLLFGMGVLELWVIKDGENNNKITLKHLPTESFLIDKYSTDLNALDATRFHKILNISDMSSLELDIKPLFEMKWADKRATVIESWIKNIDSWDRYLWNTNGFIYKYEISPFKNKKHPFVENINKMKNSNGMVFFET